MNKYLETQNDIAKILKSKFDMPSYEIFAKMNISTELEFILENDNMPQLDDLQQEKLIDIIYDFYIDSDYDCSIYKITKSFVITLQKYGSFECFKQKYYDDYLSVCDDIVFNL